PKRSPCRCCCCCSPRAPTSAGSCSAAGWRGGRRSRTRTTPPGERGDAMPRKQRNRIVRLDGKPIHLVAKRAHLMVCAKGCCCGRTDRGHPAGPVDFYKAEQKKRNIHKLV